MKTWSEDNWFTKLDKMFGTSHLTEKLTELENDGVPNSSTRLTPDNVESFKKLWRYYFNIFINIPDKPTPNDPEAGEPWYRGYRELVEILSELSGRIAARPKAKEAGAARVFYENLVECAISMYLSDAREHIEATRKCNLEALKRDEEQGTYDSERRSYLENEEAYMDKWYAPLKDRLETLKRDLLEKEVQSISADEYTQKKFPGLLGFHFDVRNIKNAREFIVNIIPKNAFAKNTFLKDKTINELEKKFKCATFTNSLKETEDGFSNGARAEIKYCSETFIRNFQKDVFNLVKDRFVPLSEEMYRMFKKHASYQGYCPALEETEAPSIEALRVGKFTEDAFKDALGGRVVVANRRVAATNGDHVMSLREFKQNWKWWYKADVLYIYSAEEGRSRYCLPIQVKYKESNNNVLIDKKDIDISVRRYLCNASNIDAVARDVAALLFGGDYVLTIDSWKKWVYLPFALETFQFKNREKHEDNKEDILNFNIAGWDMILRVPKPAYLTDTARMIVK